MNSAILQSIPYQTNSSNRSFNWFAIYDNDSIITEEEMNFTSLSTSGIHYFGLYGNNFHFISDLIDGQLRIQTKKFDYTFKTFITSSLFSSNDFNHLYNIEPIELKKFEWESDATFSNINSSSTIFLNGFNGLLLLDNKYPITTKTYFQIDCTNLSSLTIKSQIIPIKDLTYPDTQFSYIASESVEDSLCTKYNTKPYIRKVNFHIGDKINDEFIINI